MIKHNSYFEGAVQSLGFETDGKKTVGVMVPGTHDFGVASIPETITVITGAFTAKGVKYVAGQKFSFEPGDKIVFINDVTSAYLCEY